MGTLFQDALHFMQKDNFLMHKRSREQLVLLKKLFLEACVYKPGNICLPPPGVTTEEVAELHAILTMSAEERCTTVDGLREKFLSEIDLALVAHCGHL